MLIQDFVNLVEFEKKGICQNMPYLIASVVATSGVNMIRSLFAPGLSPRESEPYDRRYYNEGFDPEFYDDVDDYITLWQRKEWPKQNAFETVMEQVRLCAQVYDGSDFMKQLLVVMERVYNEIFNKFESTYDEMTRVQCFIWLRDTNMLKQLNRGLAMEEDDRIYFRYELVEDNM